MFALNPVGITGSIVQQLNHGISTGALFLIVGIVYERRHTREISEYGGLSKVMPVYAAVFLIMTMSSIGLPTLNGFVGEFLILLGSFAGFFLHAKIYTAVAATGVILSAVYMLWMFQRVNYGVVTNPKNRSLRDLSTREWFVIGPVCAMAIFMGVFPGVFLKPMEPSVRRVVEHTRGSMPMNASDRGPTVPAAPLGTGPERQRIDRAAVQAPAAHVVGQARRTFQP
jgi:NADH-quinone oxidoreductase subunit M